MLSVDSLNRWRDGRVPWLLPPHVTVLRTQTRFGHGL